ncbi:YopX family protein [Flavobacterium humidisoli]|uniref:YopX family protein n=1 Tax=Flavobacterium humidisoli TaxID=2937442 RepID=A0ABY4LP48_9FLAO|nr:YopX family protein [Flavobacterium humidisoli]UPZ14632.1 YopX family protein [Flavobacterium humidisoli]
MINKVLKNLAYLLYPRNLSFDKENSRYIASDEYLRLNQIIGKFDSEIKEIFSKDILKEFENDYTLKNFTDNTLFNWGDRCMTFNVTLIEDGEMYTISLLISVIVPYYAIKCQKNMIELFFSESRISELQEANLERRKLKEIIFEIESIIEKKLLYSKFPKELYNFVIEDVSFQEADFGYFKMFNAFFNNLIMTENEE